MGLPAPRSSEVGGAVLSFVGDGFDFLGEIDLHVGTDGVAGYDYQLYEPAVSVERLSPIVPEVEGRGTRATGDRRRRLDVARSRRRR